MSPKQAGLDPRAIDRVIHERSRLALMSLLAAGGKISFVELKEKLDMTDGNLSRHLTTLQERGYVTCKRYARRGRPRTEVMLTKEGRDAFSQYLKRLEAILEVARPSREDDLAVDGKPVFSSS